MKITIDNDMMIGTFILNTLEPEIDELNNLMKAQGYPDHAVYAPTILSAVHEIIAKVATENGKTFDEVLQEMSEVEKENPAMGNKTVEQTTIDYRYFEREKK